ncbi:MAG: hypothetical protein Q8O67_15370 [Deltaproteobacteria bacterium]|nr:hypothetical protein [Deltaproteobacteria bacterium]
MHDSSTSTDPVGQLTRIGLCSHQQSPSHRKREQPKAAIAVVVVVASPHARRGGSFLPEAAIFASTPEAPAADTLGRMMEAA